ncbi:MAG: L,D-transpeptidase family protein [Clostridium sp.]|uniref:L,D-transpeptidase family protein n=1 Tax=Clostridium sp. TaxID=1506 RepID=UPI0025C47045|nr:L,D-transpeptidase family protein [Clostridium sp.]MCE5221275.1 L,D-transpeptidase family protein [Clostridium sp.]
MKKTILSVAVAEIIISCSMQTNAHAATINNTNDSNKNTSTISTLQKSEKVISIGSKGDVVRSIQRLLNSLEGCNIQEDGLYGAETYNAIIKYQAKNALKQDGIVGKQTIAKLLSIDVNSKLNTTNSNTENGTKATKVQTVNEMIISELNSKEINSDTDYFVAVSKSQRQVYIYHKEYDSWVNIKVFTCNIGSPDSPTIEGNFYSGLKGKELRINETCVKYFTQISGNYLFHSVPYNDIGEVIDGRLGEAVSHGCVRLSLEDSKYIYDTIPAKTGIKIIK